METRLVQVLLVEDSPVERRWISAALSAPHEPEFRLTEVNRLSQAQSHLREGLADVVVLDLSLPDSGGLTAVTTLCQEFPPVPVVVFTGLDDTELALPALREGAQDFLVQGQTEPGALQRTLLYAIERKRADMALHRRQERLAEAKRLETVGRLAGKIAHDFNNILTTIVGFSDLLVEDMQGHSCIEDLLEIKRAGDRGSALTRSILTFSRREPPVLDAVGPDQVLSDLRGTLEQLLPENISLQLDLRPDQPEILADVSQVEQALVNLVANARDAMPKGGTVTISTEPRTIVAEPPLSSPLPGPGQYLAVVVRDNGTGMDAQTCQRIFEPFFTTKPKGTGIGLGLSLVLSVMRGVNGGIEVRSEPGAGTSISLYFPIASASGGKDKTDALEYNAASGLDLPSILQQDPAAARHDR
jgi:signal transduction histidine kinase